MADVKISGLSAVASVAGANEFAVNEAGTSKKATATQIKTFTQVGTTTNDNAAAGSVGEYVEATLAVGSAVSLTTATGKTVTSISLTAGDWDVTGIIGFVTGGTTTVGTQIAGAHTTTDAIGADNTFSEINYAAGTTLDTNYQNRLPIPTQRFSLSGTTTVYLVAKAFFGVSTMTAYGQIRARRIR